MSEITELIKTKIRAKARVFNLDIGIYREYVEHLNCTYSGDKGSVCPHWEYDARKNWHYPNFLLYEKNGNDCFNFLFFISDGGLVMSSFFVKHYHERKPQPRFDIMLFSMEDFF